MPLVILTSAFALLAFLHIVAVFDVAPRAPRLTVANAGLDGHFLTLGARSTLNTTQTNSKLRQFAAKSTENFEQEASVSISSAKRNAEVAAHAAPSASSTIVVAAPSTSALTIPSLLDISARASPQLLDSLPARSPPSWAYLTAEADCAQLIEGSGHDRTLPRPVADFHAGSAAFDEDGAGAVLLGECICPLFVQPNDGWLFPCEDYDWRILSELAPWHSINLTHAMLDSAFELNLANLQPGYHFSIHGGRIFMKMREPLSSFHSDLLDMLRTFAELVPLPDVEFVMHAWDHSKAPRQDPVPVFGFIRDAARTEPTVPYAYSWSSISHSLDLSSDPSCPLWPARDNRLLFRGGCSGPTRGYDKALAPLYLRYRATALTHLRPKKFDAGLSEACVSPSEVAGMPGADLTPLKPLNTRTGQCQYKHLLLLDGNTATGRSSSWFASGSVIFKPDSVFSEWYYHALKPWVHFVPVRERLEDLEVQFDFVSARPRLGECIAQNSKAFAKRHLRREALACYFFRLMTALARRMPVGSRTDGFVPI